MPAARCKLLIQNSQKRTDGLTFVALTSSTLVRLSALHLSPLCSTQSLFYHDQQREAEEQQMMDTQMLKRWTEENWNETKQVHKDKGLYQTANNMLPMPDKPRSRFPTLTSLSEEEERGRIVSLGLWNLDCLDLCFIAKVELHNHGFDCLFRSWNVFYRHVNKVTGMGL